MIFSVAIKGYHMRFKNRTQAAGLLSKELKKYKNKNPLILGIPRGAMPIAEILHQRLGGDLDVVLVHKIGAPDHPEFAIGAVSESGLLYLSPIFGKTQSNSDPMRELIQREVQRLKMRRELYASLKVDVSPLNKTVILVDDGIATGATILSAIQVVKSLKPKRLICAVPVASSQAIQLIEKEVDELVVLERPREFYSVSQFYDDFEQVSDDQVVQILKRSQAVKNVREKKVQRMEGESFRQRGLDHDKF